MKDMEDTKDKKDTIDLLNISKISNSEIFTPLKTVKEMVSLIPENMFKPNTKFIDPACKTGRFLVEIKDKLMDSSDMKQAFPNESDRLNHILNNQLYGLATSEIALLIANRNLYGYGLEERNIKYIENYIKHIANKSTNYKKLITKEFGDMEFDIVIGNPPYNDGNKDIFDEFMIKLTDINCTIISLIVPSKYFTDERERFSKLRNMYLNNHMKHIVDYVDWRTVPFYNKDLNSPIIGGGVHYFLYDKRYNGDCKVKTIIGNNTYESVVKMYSNEYFIRFTFINSILHRININSIKDHIIGNQAFGIPSYINGKYQKSNVYSIYVKEKDCYISRNEISKNFNIIDKYKVVVGYRAPGNNTLSDGKFKVLTLYDIYEPNEVCTQNYTVIAAFDNEEYAENFKSYLKTKFVRILIEITLMNGSISPQNFRFVPMQDFSHPWTDEQLYKKYNLTQEEIDYIEKIIKPMD